MGAAIGRQGVFLARTLGGKIDTRKLLTDHMDRLDVCPINSGNFRQGGANTLRGDWIYTPIRQGLDTFRSNRQRRGLKHTADSVKEVSLRGGLTAAALRDVLA